MEAEFSPEMLVITNQAILCQNSEDNMKLHRRETLESQTVLFNCIIRHENVCIVVPCQTRMFLSFL
jgi:hypothetical protein